MLDIEVAQAANALLGEGPVWSRSERVLYWVDIQRPAVFRFDPRVGQTGIWPTDGPVGFAVPRARGGLVAGIDGDLVAIDTATGDTSVLVAVESDRPGNRLNDGTVDRRGRLWSGTMDRQARQPTGSLYRIDPDLTVTRHETGLICSNGIGWSPDGRTMYLTDSGVRTVWAYDFDEDAGTLGRRRVLVELDPDDGVPDGLTVDADGHIWSAVWNGWRIVRHAPDGRLDREIRMPVQRPTSCAFGGSRLDQLYVSSAWAGLDGRALADGPLAGALFRIDAGITGQPETPFAG